MTTRAAALLTLMAIVAASHGLVGAPQTPTFRAGVEAVRVDVLVTEDNRTVPGLRAEDFEVRDNGVPQEVRVVDSARLPLNVVLALDASASVTGERLQHLKEAARAVVGGLSEKDRAALLTFSHTLRLESPLTSDFAGVRAGIERIAPAGSTALYDAAYTGLTLAESEVGRSLLIVFSDGLDTASFFRREAVAEAARNTEVVAYAAAVVAPRRPPFLKDFANETSGRLLEIESTRDLPATFLKILEEFRQRYVLMYSPKNTARGGWHRIEVRVRNRRVSVKARAGYQSGG